MSNIKDIINFTTYIISLENPYITWKTNKLENQLMIITTKIRTYLLCEGCNRSGIEDLKKLVKSRTARVKNEHASIKVQGRWRIHVNRPWHPIRALLAVPNFELQWMAPCLLAKTVHGGIEVAVWCVKQVVYVFKHLNISIQIYHLLVLLKLQIISYTTFGYDQIDMCT